MNNRSRTVNRVSHVCTFDVFEVRIAVVNHFCLCSTPVNNRSLRHKRLSDCFLRRLCVGYACKQQVLIRAFGNFGKIGRQIIEIDIFPRPVQLWRRIPSAGQQYKILLASYIHHYLVGCVADIQHHCIRYRCKCGRSVRLNQLRGNCADYHFGIEGIFFHNILIIRF